METFNYTNNFWYIFNFRSFKSHYFVALFYYLKDSNLG